MLGWASRVAEAPSGPDHAVRTMGIDASNLAGPGATRSGGDRCATQA
jgi:hypothetical protein